MGRIAGRGIGTYVETDDRAFAGFGQGHIRIGDRAHARREHAHAHLFVANLFQGLHDGFGRTLHVGLHQHRQLSHVHVSLGLRHQLFQRGRSPGSGALVFCGLDPVIGDFTRRGFGFDDVQRVTRRRCTRQAQHFDRNRRSSLGNRLAFRVDERADLAPLLADDKDIAFAQGAVLHQNGGNRATAHIQLGFDHSTGGAAVRVGLEFQNFRLKRNGLQQIVQTHAGFRRHFHILHIARHRFDNDFVLQQIGADLGRIGAVLVHLVDGHDQRHLGRLGMGNRLNRLGHDGIVSGNHQHNNVGHIRTARPHRGKGGVARGVEEGQNLPLIGFHLIGTDVLGDTTGFARDHIGLADRIQKRGLAVVNVAHDRHDRRAGDAVFICIRDRFDRLLHVGIRHSNRLVAKLFDHQFGGVGVDGLVQRHHHAHFHERFDNVCPAFSHTVGQLADHDDFGQLHVAELLFRLVAKAHRLVAGLFLLALHRGKAARAPAFTIHGRRQRQLARTTTFVALGLGVALALFAFAVGLARGRQSGLGAGRAALVHPWGGCRAGVARRSGGFRARGGCSRFGSSGLAALRAQNVGLALFRTVCGLKGRFGAGALFFLDLGAQGGLAGAVLTFLGFDFFAPTHAVFFARPLFFGTLGSVFLLARLGLPQGGQAAFHLGIGDACRALGRIAQVGRATRGCARARPGLARRRHHNALALGFNHHSMRPAMGEALLHRTGTRCATQAEGFFTVSIAHASYISFMAVEPPSCSSGCAIRNPESLAASSTTRVVSPPAPSAACIARSRPKAKPNSPAVKRPINRPSPSGGRSLVLPRSDPSEACTKTRALPDCSQSFTFS